MSESSAKKDKAKKKIRERQDKAEKMRERRANNNKGKTLEEMMAYVDENGNLSSTPPDKRIKREIPLESIQLGAAPVTPEDLVRTGTVSFFNDAKGYGFIADDKTRENVFFHNSKLTAPVKERDKVTFEKERGPKGYSATNIKKLSK